MSALTVSFKNNHLNHKWLLANEVRNPLANINLALVILKMPQLDIDRNAYLDIIMRSSRRINSLVSQLLLN